MILLNEYSELPLNEELPESYIIEDILSENAESNPNVTQIDDVENTAASPNEEDRGSVSAETTTELQPCTLAAEPTFGEYFLLDKKVYIVCSYECEEGIKVFLVPKLWLKCPLDAFQVGCGHSQPMYGSVSWRAMLPLVVTLT